MQLPMPKATFIELGIYMYEKSCNYVNCRNEIKWLNEMKWFNETKIEFKIEMILAVINAIEEILII